jgi:hypothetical protein
MLAPMPDAFKHLLLVETRHCCQAIAESLPTGVIKSSRPSRARPRLPVSQILRSTSSSLTCDCPASTAQRGRRRLGGIPTSSPSWSPDTDVKHAVKIGAARTSSTPFQSTSCCTCHSALEKWRLQSERVLRAQLEAVPLQGVVGRAGRCRGSFNCSRRSRRRRPILITGETGL